MSGQTQHYWQHQIAKTTKPKVIKKPKGKNKSSPKNTVAIDGKTTEVLRAAPPHGWHQIYQLNNDAVRLADFVPQGQTNLAWKTKLSFESNSDLVDIEPIKILLSKNQPVKYCRS